MGILNLVGLPAFLQDYEASVLVLEGDVFLTPAQAKTLDTFVATLA